MVDTYTIDVPRHHTSTSPPGVVLIARHFVLTDGPHLSVPIRVSSVNFGVAPGPLRPLIWPLRMGGPNNRGKPRI